MVGFNLKNSETFAGMYVCPACSLVLREPCQLPCSHRQCKTCIDAVPREIIECSECGTAVPKHEIIPDRGCRNDMKHLPVVCSLCEWNGIFKEYEEHQNQEHSNLTDVHDQQGFSATSLIGENNRNHLFRDSASSITTYGSCSELSYTNGSFNDDFDPIQQNSVPELVDRAESQTFGTHDENALNMEIPVAQALATPVVLATIETNTETIQERIHFVGEQMRNLHGNMDRLHQNTIQLRHALMSMLNEMVTIRTSYEEQTVSIHRNRSNETVLRQDLASIRQAIDEKQHTSCDGILTWKITDVREKIMNAQSERQISIYSPPFYSSPGGYKMRALLYLNGDGNARRTHMSLFFALMRGPNDAILKFPFNYKVTFCLHDQATQENDIIDSFCPDVQLNSFQQPRSDTNIPIGIPKFCPLALIGLEGNPYVQDDTMFIRVIVDFANLPRSLLTYDAKINPGFPMHVRQMKIAQELAKRAGGEQVLTSSTDADTQTTLSCEVTDVDDN